MSDHLDFPIIQLFHVPPNLIKLAKKNAAEAEKIIQKHQENINRECILRSFRQYFADSPSAKKKRKRFPDAAVLVNQSVDPPSGPNASQLFGFSNPTSLKIESFTESSATANVEKSRKRSKKGESQQQPVEVDSDDEVVVQRKTKKKTMVISSDESDLMDSIDSTDVSDKYYTDSEPSSPVSGQASEKSANRRANHTSKPLSKSNNSAKNSQNTRSFEPKEKGTSSTRKGKLSSSCSPIKNIKSAMAASNKKVKLVNLEDDTESVEDGEKEVDTMNQGANSAINPSSSKCASTSRVKMQKNSNKKQKGTSNSQDQNENADVLSDSDIESLATVKSKRKLKRNRIPSSSSSSSQTGSEKDSETGSSTEGEGGKGNAKSKKSKSKKGSNKRRSRIRYYEDEGENTDDEIGCVYDSDLDGEKVNGGGSHKCEKSDKGESSPEKGEKMKKILSAHELAKETRLASRAETERRQRIQERQTLYNQIASILEEEQRSSSQCRVILDFDEKSKQPSVEVHPELASQLKKHQIEGIKFMYSATIESAQQLCTTEGSGCILAHSMGLGKTLQVIAFVHSLMTSAPTKEDIRYVLVICPKNTSRNWASEFNNWLYDKNITDFITTDFEDYTSNSERSKALEEFDANGGVLIINSNIFPKLVHAALECESELKKPRPKSKRARAKSNQEYFALIRAVLLEKPDLVIIDEGHLIKSDKSKLNQAVTEISTKRRVILTGTPLQNNLTEYYHMVNFIKPNLLGSHKEFQNRFENPIKRGQMEDSSNYDVNLMKRRVHVLHKLLDACVHRCDYTVLAPYLQPKHEYVLKIRLSSLQIQLYQQYLERFAARKSDDKGRSYLFKDCSTLRLICAHPYLLRDLARREDERNEEDFINDQDESSFDSDSSLEAFDRNGHPMPLSSRRVTRSTKTEETADCPETELLSESWFEQLIPKMQKQECIAIGSKMELFFQILTLCEKIGDKLLVFSQSLDTLNLIESFLELASEKPSILDDFRDTKSASQDDLINTWVRDVDYFRLDGQSKSDTRKNLIDRFNDPENIRARLFLISTRAGSLGINLVGANRCIIFDSSWNPSHDVQAIFRIYRFGQEKPVYVYRFVAHGTMENRIYDRQIVKQALAMRVVDDQQIVRHFKENEIAELYKFEPEPETEQIPLVPKDKLLADILRSEKTSKLVVNYHEHDSLLENRPEEDLPDEERNAAWKEYEDERKLEEERQHRHEQEVKRQQEMIQFKPFAFQLYDQIRANRKFKSSYDFSQLVQKELSERISSLKNDQSARSEADSVAAIEKQIDAYQKAIQLLPNYAYTYLVDRRALDQATPPVLVEVSSPSTSSIVHPVNTGQQPSLPRQNQAQPILELPLRNEADLQQILQQLHSLRSQQQSQGQEGQQAQNDALLQRIRSLDNLLGNPGSNISWSKTGPCNWPFVKRSHQETKHNAPFVKPLLLAPEALHFLIAPSIDPNSLK